MNKAFSTFVLLSLLVTTASAQMPGRFPAPVPIEELTISPGQPDVVELAPSGETTLTYSLTNQGEAPLALTLVGMGRGGFGGGFEGSRPPRDEGFNGTRPPPGEGGFAGRASAQTVNATLLGDPNITLEPAGSATVIYAVRVSGDGQPGDWPVTLLARDRDGNRTSTYTTTIRVLAPAVDDTSDAEPATTDSGVAAGSQVAGDDVRADTPSLGMVATSVGVVAAAMLFARRKR